MPHMRNILILSFLALLMAGCGETETSFDVDPTELASAHADSLLGLSFQPPLGFRSADLGFLQSVRRQMLQTPGAGGRFFIVPTMIFAPDGSDARCFLSEFPNIGAAKFDAKWKQTYLAEASEKAPGLTVDSRDVAIDGISLLEIEIESPQSINRRYVFQGLDGRFIQIDYIVPVEERESLLPRLGSSIGSLKLY